MHDRHPACRHFHMLLSPQMLSELVTYRVMQGHGLIETSQLVCMPMVGHLHIAPAGCVCSPALCSFALHLPHDRPYPERALPETPICRCRNERFEDEGELKHLSEMLWYADQAYEGESEKTLSQRLSKKGLV